MEGHLAANFLTHADLDEHHLSLIVSGGHTMLLEVQSFGEYTLLGNTKDDAVGEAFDKVGKIMGLGYPAGAVLDKLAQTGDASYMKFPRAIMREQSYMFSYSGLKTAVSMHIKSLTDEEFHLNKANIAASFQEAAIEVLVEKTLRASKDKNISHIALSGGVASNSRIRSMFAERLQGNQKLFYPPIALCTDNAAMIATAGYLRYKKDGRSELITNAVPYLKIV